MNLKDVMSIAAVVVVVTIFCVVWAVPNVPEVPKAVATLILGRFLGYLDVIYSNLVGKKKEE